MNENLENNIKQELESWNELKDKVLNVIPVKEISFRTRALLSDILDRLELSRQDRKDLEKYIIYGGGENIEYIKSTIGDLLNKVPELNYLIDNVETLIYLFNKLDELLKKESPFEKGEGENSAVLKGGDNQALSENSVAMGKNNIVGLKGWYYGSINKINDTTIDVYISESQRRPTWGGTTKLSNINPYKVLGYNTVVSLVNDVKYDNEFRVVGGEAGRIRLTTVSGNLPFSSITTELLLDSEDYSIYCLSNPDAGVADIGQGSFASGYNNKATNGKATAFGYDNHAYGKFSFTEGKSNIASYASHAEGRSTQALGQISHAEGNASKAIGEVAHAEGEYTEARGRASHSEGRNTIANGDYSHCEGRETKVDSKYAHAEGYKTQATGNASHAEGYTTESSGQFSHAEGTSSNAIGTASHVEGVQTIANNKAEHASGTYNKSTTSTDVSKATHFSIGIGTSATDRKNAVEAKQNGDVYITGIGGFTGANSDSSKSVQEVINELVNKLNEITTND